MDSEPSRHGGDEPCVADAAKAPVRCPLCGVPSQPRFEKHGYAVLVCRGCDHHFADVPLGADHLARTYGDSYFCGGGAGYPDYLAEHRLLRRQGERYARTVGRFTPPGRVLDIGSAAGFILRGFVDQGWEGVGVEPNAAMVRHARDELGLDVRQTSLEDAVFEPSFHLATMIQVIAHLVDPVRELRRVRDWLLPGGWLLIETWDRESLIARLLGQGWHEYAPPSVLHYFGRRQLVRVLSRIGFARVAGGRPSKWIAAAHAKSLLRYHGEQRPLLRPLAGLVSWVPDAWSIPYPAFDLRWMLFRKMANWPAGG